MTLDVCPNCLPWTAASWPAGECRLQAVVRRRRRLDVRERARRRRSDSPPLTPTSLPSPQNLPARPTSLPALSSSSARQPHPSPLRTSPDRPPCRPSSPSSCPCRRSAACGRRPGGARSFWPRTRAASSASSARRARWPRRSRSPGSGPSSTRSPRRCVRWRARRRRRAGGKERKLEGASGRGRSQLGRRPRPEARPGSHTVEEGPQPAGCPVAQRARGPAGGRRGGGDEDARAAADAPRRSRSSSRS